MSLWHGLPLLHQTKSRENFIPSSLSPHCWGHIRSDDFWRISPAQNLTSPLKPVTPYQARTCSVMEPHLHPNHWLPFLVVRASLIHNWPVGLPMSFLPSLGGISHSLLDPHDRGTGPECCAGGSPSCSVLFHSFWFLSILAKVQSCNHIT